jgi:BirA family biotin operon repressor/biotin-[acetyl-CoA-carboxylase] ligase
MVTAMSAGTRFGDVRRLAEVDSTNRYLLDEARAGAEAGMVVVADHQSEGRGRLGRRWEAPAGANLLVSVLLRPALAVSELHLCTLAMALAARTACAAVTAVLPALKWPNDLVVGERKLAGILAETLPDDTGGRAVVVGLGVNVGWPAPEGEPGADEPPVDLGPATSLWRESGRRISPRDLLPVLLQDLGGRLDELASAEGRRRLTAEYRSCCATLGQEVRVTLPGETVTGSVADITVEGHLLVDVGACIRTITAGDVVHLRASH